MAMNIKNVEVERLAAEVAELAGESKTEAVRKALEERRARLRLRVAKRSHANRLRFLETRIWSEVPDRALGRCLTKKQREAILGYGPEGV
jgi:antitoxin VapB